jgi:thioredoxin 1
MIQAIATLQDMKLTTMTEEDFAREVLASPQPVLVDFATNWCPPCRALAPVLSALASERTGLTVKSIDAEACRSIAARYDVRSFPTLIVFSDGREVSRSVGLASKEKLIERLKL